MSGHDEIDFTNRFFLYVNQVFGDLNVRKKILEFFKIGKKALQIVKYEGDIIHHVANDLSSKKNFCSIEQGQQIWAGGKDASCQSYSIYNTVFINKEKILAKNKKKDETFLNYISSLESLEKVNIRKSKKDRLVIVKNNVTKMTDLLLFLINQKIICEEINDLIFENLKDEYNDYLLKSEGVTLKDVVANLIIVLNEWKEYGYKYLV